MMPTHPLPCPARLVTLALGALALLGAGCADDGGGDGSDDDTPSTDTDAETTGSATNAATGTTDASADTTDGPTTGEPGTCAVAPGAWTAPDWDANAADALAMRAQLDALTGDALMRGAETGAVALAGLDDLVAVWDGTPSLAEAANPGFVAIAEGALGEFVTVIAAGEQDLLDDQGAWAPGPDGGIWGESDRGIDEGGLEVRQLVDKGGFSGGVLYAYALGLTEGEIDTGTIDAIAAAWGSDAALDPKAMPTDAASYAFQMGLFGDMATALGDAKAYAADEACVAERDAALVSFFNQWEQSMYARLVFYGNRAEGKLLVAVTDSEFADVLHDLGEGIGVAVGFRGLPDPATGPLAGGGRIIADADIDAIMTAFGVDLADLGASTTGLFVESLPNLETAVEAAEGVVMDVYGVDIATIQMYAMPTPG